MTLAGAGRDGANPVRCFIGLGSNLDRPLRQIDTACERLAALAKTRLVATSPRYGNRALTQGQPDYVNAVVELDTTLSADELLTQLQLIEAEQGRIRRQQWDARPIDLDLLLYGNEIIDTALLTVPHPRMLERAFVLRPLFDLAPALTLPDGTSLRRRLDCCPDHALTRLAP